jgi:hypothetical protein
MARSPRPGNVKLLRASYICVRFIVGSLVEAGKTVEFKYGVMKEVEVQG